MFPFAAKVFNTPGPPVALVSLTANVARLQGSKAWELSHQQRRHEHSRQSLTAIYAAYAEGLQPDLLDAKTVLDTLD
jgi:hypothetical protein